MSDEPTTPRRLLGRRIVVAGGAGSIGGAVCERLLAEGATVVAADRNERALDALVARAASERLSTAKIDLGAPASIDSGVAEAVERLGGLDAAVNAVGVSRQGTTFDDETLEGWEWVLAVNLTGAFAFAKAAVPAMTDGGSIVNITSTGAEMGLPLNLAYGASKGGLRNLTLGLALALAPRRIRVNAVGPGLMEFPVRKTDADEQLRTGQDQRVPFGRLGRGSDVAGAVAFLVSDDGEWVTGQNLYVDGGSSAT